MREGLIGARNNGGNIVMFVAYMNATPDQNRRLQPDFDAAEREIRIRLGLTQAIDEAWYNACRMRLATEGSQFHSVWQSYRPWSTDTLVKVGIGYDPESGRLVIPIRDIRGQLVNCKMYRPGPGQGAKMVWKQAGIGPQSLVFPYEVAWASKKPIAFVEGESDVLTLLSLGIPAATGTMGANAMPFLGVAGNEFCVGRDIIVGGDADAAGEAYASKAIATFQPYATAVKQIHVPEWEGMNAKRDWTDWVLYLYREGDTRDDIRKKFFDLVSAAESVGAEARLDADPVDMEFGDAMSVGNFNVRFETKIRVISTAPMHHMVPANVDLSCRENKSYCKECAMFGRGGRWARSLDHRSQTALDASMIENDKQFRLLKKHFGIPEQCPEVTCKVNSMHDVQIVQAAPPQTTNNLNSLSAEDAYARRMEVFIVTDGNGAVEPGFDYAIRGFTYPVGKNQKAVILADKATALEGSSAARHLTPEQCASLRKSFHPPGYTAMQALRRVSNDLSRSVTGIRRRPDLHLMYRSVFHSAISFDLAGEFVSRGWIEAFVLGDTRCGKSAAFKSMSNWYGAGLLVDCKMQTVPGLLGAVETSAITGERYVLPGIVPLNDKRGPIGFDEFTGPKYGRATLMEALSSTRAEGVVRINKAAHATFNARVRSVWMANPGDGRMLNDIPGFGVERIRWLVGQPEDVARFDAAMAVTQSDVPLEVLLAPIKLEQPRIPQEDAKLLLEWSRAREPEDFVWEPDAIEALGICVRRMVEMYDQSIPLVESATQRLKLAKFAVANAMSTFSTPDGNKVMITYQHVEAAYQMFSMWYQKPSFAYHAYSERRRIESTIVDPDAVKRMFETEFGDATNQALYRLLNTESFSENTFRVICATKLDNAISILRNLMQNRCIEIDGRSKDHYRPTKAFIKWINEYIRADEPRPSRQGNINAEEQRNI